MSTHFTPGEHGSRWSATYRLSVRPPFNFAATLAFIGAFPPWRDAPMTSGETLEHSLWAGDRVVAATISGQPGDEGLRCTLSADVPLSDEQVAHARDRLSFWLSLDDDLLPFYAIAERDAAFAPVLQRLYGYHHVKFPTPFEAACWAILTQRTSLASARIARAALATRYGAAPTRENPRDPAFPRPDVLAQVQESEISAVAGGDRKAAYLLGAARAFAGVDEGWACSAPYDFVEAWLRTIPGIGPWSAVFVLIRGLGRMERLPEGERRLVEAAARVYGGVVTPERLRELGAPYGEWQGYWAHYLRVAG